MKAKGGYGWVGPPGAELYDSEDDIDYQQPARSKKKKGKVRQPTPTPQPGLGGLAPGQISPGKGGRSRPTNNQLL
jgi:hypothetical protein